MDTILNVNPFINLIMSYYSETSQLVIMFVGALRNNHNGRWKAILWKDSFTYKLHAEAQISSSLKQPIVVGLFGVSSFVVFAARCVTCLAGHWMRIIACEQLILIWHDMNMLHDSRTKKPDMWCALRNNSGINNEDEGPLQSNFCSGKVFYQQQLECTCLNPYGTARYRDKANDV